MNPTRAQRITQKIFALKEQKLLALLQGLIPNRQSFNLWRPSRYGRGAAAHGVHGRPYCGWVGHQLRGQRHARSISSKHDHGDLAARSADWTLVHYGHCAFLPAEERCFITEDLIRSTGGLVGTPDEIIAMIREREVMGLNEITLLPAMAEARRTLRDFAAKVVARY